MKYILSFSFCLLFPSAVMAQHWVDNDEKTSFSPFKNLEYKVETQLSISKNNTPLWLNANKYGLSSLTSTNAYLRTSIERPLETDSARRWAVGYGLDIVAPWHYSSKFFIQQAYAEMRWLHGSLTIGSKDLPMELKNNKLSSGSQALGINAKTVPQVRLALPQYWRLPIANGWIHFKGHIAFGKQTDENWQKTFTQKQSKYVENVLYHSKAGYIKIGNSAIEAPLSFEVGLEMAALFGGTFPVWNNQRVVSSVKGGTGFKDYMHALLPGGHEMTENDIVYKNVEGDHLGSWVMRLNYETDLWKASVYADKFFEDHSAMLQLDYDGYGTGERWNERTRNRYLLYDFKDWIIGAELNLKYGSWLRNIVLEYIYTKYQSGPIYHDRTTNLSDHIGGVDNFYNHLVYPGWQHWGQVMGNPLFLSPQYNKDGVIEVKDNRFVAYHLGIEGNPLEPLNYRILATYRRGFGTYQNPFSEKKHSYHFLLETNYALKNNWQVGVALGLDHGQTMGNNKGVQLTISKTGILTK